MSDLSVQLDFFGTIMRISANATSWIDGISGSFPYFVTDRDIDAPAFELEILETIEIPPPPGLPLTWGGTMPDGFHRRIFETEDETFLAVEDKVAVALSYQRARATAFVKPGSQDAFFSAAIILIVDAALEGGGQYLIHGACLVEQVSGRALMICAPSGSGKTTTAMALARDGFALMTDDASVVVPSCRVPGVWGLPRDLKVHRKTAELLPWLGALPNKWDRNGEQGIALSRLGDRLSVAVPCPTELAAMFLLGPRSEGNHSIAPLSKAEILIALAHDNVAWRPAGMTIKAQARFDVLAETIARVPAFVLSAGEDLASLPNMVARALEETRPTASAR